MSISETLLLPKNSSYSTMSYEEREEADQILTKKMSEHFDGFQDIFDYSLFDLFDHANGNDGDQPWKYKDFIQWVFKLMLVPENAEALHKRFNGDGGRYLQKLIDFFESLAGAETANKIWAYCHWYNITNNMRDISDRSYEFLWETYGNREKTDKK